MENALIFDSSGPKISISKDLVSCAVSPFK